MASFGWAEHTAKLRWPQLTRTRIDVAKNLSSSFRKIPEVLSVLWSALHRSWAVTRSGDVKDSPELAAWKKNGADATTRPQDPNTPTIGCGATHEDFTKYHDFATGQVRRKHIFFCSTTVLYWCATDLLFLYQFVLFRNGWSVLVQV